MLEAFLFLIPLLVLVALIAAIVYGVVAVTRRRREFVQADPGIGTVRRLYFYIVAFVALMMSANGIVQIAVFVLEGLFSSDIVSVSSSRVRLATGLSLTIVGLPLWSIHWRIIGNYVGRIPFETRSVIRKAYIYIVLAVAAGLGIGAAVAVIRWVLGSGEPFSGYTWAAIPIWAGVWAYHWRLEADEGQPTPETVAIRRIYVYGLSAGMLVVAALGVGQIIHIIFREAYEGLTSTPVLGRPGLWRAPTKDAVSLMLVAGPVWAAHWLYFARGDYESALRQIYLYALAIFGSVSTLLTAAGLAIFGALVWTIGVPEEESAVDHFRFLPGVLASAIVGGTILVYHALVAGKEVGSQALSPLGGRRSYAYALALMGLATLAAGIVTLVATAVGIFTESGKAALAGQDVWRNAVAISVTLGVLGGPLWGYYWPSIQKRVSAAGAEERTSLSRRIFIFAVLGAGMLALLGSVSIFIFVFLRELLDGALSEVLPETKVSIAFMVAAAIYLPYYWSVYRVDRRLAPEVDAEEKPYRSKAVTLLVNEQGTALVKELEGELGYDVSPLHWADPEARLPQLSEDALRELARRISESEGPNVLLVPEEATFRVLSYL